MGGLGKVGNERSESKRLLIDCPSYLSSCAGHDVGPKGLRDSGSTVPCGATPTGFTHHNREFRLDSQFQIPSESKLLNGNFAIFRVFYDYKILYAIVYII